MTKRGHQRSYQRGFEQSVPAVLGQQRTAQPVVLNPVRILGVLDLVGLLGLVLWMAFSPRFYVTEVPIQGASRVSKAEILEASELMRVHFLWLNRRAAGERIVSKLPSIEQAEVSCDIPANCTITVMESPIFLTWETEEKLLHIDEAGGIFLARQPLETEWWIDGPVPVTEQQLLEPEILAGLKDLVRLLGTQPGRIFYKEGRGLVLEDPAGWRVILGESDDMESRLMVYAKVRSFILEAGIQPQFVDVRFPKAPYYSETNEW